MVSIRHISVSEALAAEVPILDVRSPGEYARGHIPGAVSFPLFSDEERAEVGTAYKQIGKDEAMKIGLEYAGTKLRSWVEEAERIAPDGRLILHCWRGGMRSASLAWLLAFAGWEPAVIEGGYKAYRRHLLAQLAAPRALYILSGYTGSGKTELLHALARGEEVIVDLEALAHHKGSAFGHIGKGTQPTSEQFQNDLYHSLRHIPPSRPIWLEDESLMIGTVAIPDDFYALMQAAPHIWVEVPVDVRIGRLVHDYGKVDPQRLAERFVRIRKRLGGAAVNEAVDHLGAGRLAEAARIALDYYDKAYRYTFDKKETVPVHTVEAGDQALDAIALQLILWKNQRSN